MTPHRRDAWCTALPWFLLLFSGQGNRVETKYGTNRVNRGDLSWTVPSTLHALLKHHREITYVK
jgi:hypothetical protein